jgi:hypothetical protein
MVPRGTIQSLCQINSFNPSAKSVSLVESCCAPMGLDHLIVYLLILCVLCVSDSPIAAVHGLCVCVLDVLHEKCKKSIKLYSMYLLNKYISEPSCVHFTALLKYTIIYRKFRVYYKSSFSPNGCEKDSESLST